MTAPKPLRTAYCFDLDATVTEAEILPAIAQAFGIGGDMAALTRGAMDGLTDFETSMRQRCQILAQIAPHDVQAVVEGIPLNPDIVQFIKQNADDCCIITGNLDVWTAPLRQVLPCVWRSSRAHYAGSGLVVDQIIDKGQEMRDMKSQRRFGRFIAIGDGANDIPMFQAADIAIAFAGMHPPAPAVLNAAHHSVGSGAALVALLQRL
jgi:phosphoserine phosphatase